MNILTFGTQNVQLKNTHVFTNLTPKRQRCTAGNAIKNNSKRENELPLKHTHCVVQIVTSFQKEVFSSLGPKLLRKGEEAHDCKEKDQDSS